MAKNLSGTPKIKFKDNLCASNPQSTMLPWHIIALQHFRWCRPFFLTRIPTFVRVKLWRTSQRGRHQHGVWSLSSGLGQTSPFCGRKYKSQSLFTAIAENMSVCRECGLVSVSGLVGIPVTKAAEIDALNRKGLSLSAPNVGYVNGRK